MLRQKTKIAQKLPSDLEDKKYVIKLRKSNDYSLSLIANMDETPMFFDLMDNQTVHKKGGKQVLAKTTGHDKQHFTVVLACMADGKKLPPMVIFKRKTFPKKENFPRGVVVHMLERGWMDERGCLKWIEDVWANQPGGLMRKKSMLVWDMFKAHLSEDVKTSLKAHNTDIAVIPGGLTSLLQPLEPFKDYIRQCWNKWMTSGLHTITPAGNMRAASLSTVCEWVLKAWNEVRTESVIKSFKKCSISNAMDGTEDDLLWEEEEETATAQNDDDEAEGPYDNMITAEEWDELFGQTDDEEGYFEGFEL